MKGSLLKKYLISGREINSPGKQMFCMAPFKSLRLGPQGRITVCCHNNRNIVGFYPSQSLHQIWNADRINHLRDTFLKHHYPEGCAFCVREAKGNQPGSGSPALYQRFQVATEQPVILDFKADNRCNLACIMCSGLSSSSYQDTPAPYRNPYDTPAFMDELRQWAPFLCEARFSGGEPFLSDFYFKVWNLLSEINPACKIVVQTNGTILNAKIKDILYRGNFHINVSVDSFNEPAYASIRRGSSLKQITPNLQWFREYCLSNDRFWGMTACAMQENRTEFVSIVEHWNTYGARGWFSLVLFPPARALWTLPVAEVEQICHDLSGISFNGNTETERYNSKTFGLLKHSLEEILQTARTLQHPESGDLCGRDAFLDLVAESLRIEESSENDLITNKIRRALSEGADLLYNKNSFLRYAAETSPALLRELFELMDDRGITHTLNAFLTKPT